MRLWLDEMIADEVARQLRRSGYDALGAQESEQSWARGLDDAQQLEIAVQQNRVLVSYNVVDFVALSREWAQALRPHAGILLIHHRTVATNDIGGLVRRLARFLEDHRSEGSLADLVIFLQ